VIPTVLVVAFVGGLLFPARGWWIVAVTAIAWAVLVLFEVDGSQLNALELIGAAALGALNAAVGVVAGIAIRRGFQRASRPE
jgi:hypothetical protein